ncbi:hypothetical protein [Williamsia deligens]|uniref:DNA-binding protein n=1 Tax=Williamsia deligens TaxID=321325 RepID=A0ABW3G7W8_9NOCA|nr:hypothetical protein [Williamsia deligens]MCP2192665.1 hypothetical protein [Williamsia deligens]
MSTAPTRPPVARPVPGPTQLNDLPTVKGRDGAVEFLNRTLGVPITPTRMRAAIERRELPVYKISGNNYLTERDLYLWVKSLARPVATQGGAA